MFIIARTAPRASKRGSKLVASFSQQAWPDASRDIGTATEHPSRPRSSSSRASPERRRVFSGIQPTGIPHLGNYLGALRPWVELQNDRSNICTFCVVDLHALTVPQRADSLQRWRKESLASLLAVGLDPKKSTIFLQSEVRAHCELMWILSTVASAGQLSRMTQWKSKLNLPDTSSVDESAAQAILRLGLFSYPVLQAADILLYRTSHVPVGEDQLQHIEFARSVAKSFNHQYGKVFNLPEPMVSPAKRIMSLKDPTLKMSKSYPDPMSRILITDSPEEIGAKIKVGLTDSDSRITYDAVKRPGVSNLIEILRHTSETTATCEELAQDLDGHSMRAFKEHVSRAVTSCLSGIRETYLEIIDPTNIAKLEETRKLGALKASSRAGSTMKTVQKHLGIADFGFVPAEWRSIDLTTNE